MSLYQLTTWLENTAGSTAIRESIWVYPIIETTHVLSLTLFLGLIVMLDVRLVGWTLRRVPVQEIVERVLPWALVGFALSVVTGLLLFYSSPVRMAHNIFFRFKVLLLVLAGLNAWAFHRGIYRSAGEWDGETRAPNRARVAGLVSLALWTAIVVAGRMIAYNWFDCGNEQSALLDFLAGCGPEFR